jgi:sodium-dependent dicarboxylate transporter 2/3/5
MLPVSTPPNAIVYGTGLIPLRAMISSGLWLDLAGGVVIWIGLRLLCPVLGLV